MQQFTQFYGSTYFGTFSRVELRYAFDLMDKNRNGYLDTNDFEQIFKHLNWHTKYDLESVFESMDMNEDGRICFEGKI